MRVDFSRRVEPKELPELMDGPCSFEEFRDCLVDLEKVNRWSLGYRPTLRWMEGVAREGETLRVLDVGCGGGDMLRRVDGWARARGLKVQLTGVDVNPYAARAARGFTCPKMGIEWVTGDALELNVGEVDVVINSLLMHHLSTTEVVRLLGWMERVARVGWFVNDLCREEMPYRVYPWLAKAAGLHRFVQHDGPVSFRRSFREADWERMCSAAGVGPVAMQRWTPGRLCVGRVK